MHIHLVSLHRISSADGAGGFILPRGIVATAKAGKPLGAAIEPPLLPLAEVGGLVLGSASGPKEAEITC